MGDASKPCSVMDVDWMVVVVEWISIFLRRIVSSCSDGYAEDSAAAGWEEADALPLLGRGCGEEEEDSAFTGWRAEDELDVGRVDGGRNGVTCADDPANATAAGVDCACATEAGDAAPRSDGAGEAISDAAALTAALPLTPRRGVTGAPLPLELRLCEGTAGAGEGADGCGGWGAAATAADDGGGGSAGGGAALKNLRCPLPADPTCAAVGVDDTYDGREEEEEEEEEDGVEDSDDCVERPPRGGGAWYKDSVGEAEAEEDRGAELGNDTAEGGEEEEEEEEELRGAARSLGGPDRLGVDMGEESDPAGTDGDREVRGGRLRAE